jgi:hypothetical protein
MDEKLIAACQMFAIPAAILFLATGYAETEPPKTLLSATCLGLSTVWFMVGRSWNPKLSTADRIAILGLAGTFWIASVISTAAHLWRLVRLSNLAILQW